VRRGKRSFVDGVRLPGNLKYRVESLGRGAKEKTWTLMDGASFPIGPELWVATRESCVTQAADDPKQDYFGDGVSEYWTV
jgi:hypothetical protein